MNRHVSVKQLLVINGRFAKGDMMKSLIFVVSMISISACDSEGNLGREESSAWHRRMSTSEKIAFFKPRCEAYGFQDGSSEMASCIQDEIQDSAANARARQDRVQAAIAESNSNLAANRNQRVRATCTTSGSLINCY